MATRIEQINLLTDPLFQQQVGGAFLFAAISVLNENADTQNHANRLKYASAVFADPRGEALRNLTYLLTNATIAATAGNPAGASGTPFPDSDIDFTVGSLWDQLSNNFAART